ncbi:MAG: hypothetical protein ACD_11C00024G0002 [uncultured bacterium]|nr:MAG: hypothetical protein ACD_11C00024G0002 [uncultured bacterium]
MLKKALLFHSNQMTLGRKQMSKSKDRGANTGKKGILVFSDRQCKKKVASNLLDGLDEEAVKEVFSCFLGDELVAKGMRVDPTMCAENIFTRENGLCRSCMKCVCVLSESTCLVRNECAYGDICKVKRSRRQPIRRCPEKPNHHRASISAAV